MNRGRWTVAPLLFGSGTCALVYQVAWLREFRLVFGASTAASAAVLAIFMGGLGIGGLVLGRRADRHPNPLRFYAQLELLIAVSAAVTPGLIWLARHLYIALGGSISLGLIGATGIRLALSALVLVVPTVLMGGTLPAAARSIETDDDLGRSGLAILYGVNTLGAVAGTLLTTFLLLEALGTHKALWTACLLNGCVGAVAWWLSRNETGSRVPALSSQSASRLEPAETATTGIPKQTEMQPQFILILAGVVGFAFFLMEMVWYRMLAPLLGGTTYTFGLILAVALLGIGLGGTAYAYLGRGRAASVGGLATTCAVEALLVAIPFALGDRLAVLAALSRSLASVGFAGSVLGWSFITCVVILPVAVVAGIQFPLLIALLGRGGRDVGRHTGTAYAWNTGGAILGSLAGGFGLLPLVGAVGTWRAVVLVLAIFAAALAFRSRRTGKRPTAIVASAAATLAAIALLFSTGPTSAWRHSGIGAGRAKIGSTRNEIRDWIQGRRRCVQWTAEGIESSICITDANGIALLNNGKSDGNAKIDASTVVMLGITAGILHPRPQSALVVGLGTGMTAGWLAAIPSIERVDVVELEPAVVEVARRCSVANRRVLDNPKVHLILGDAREVLLASSRGYDLIVSEPSNPFRAGLASLFSQEFYDAVRARLNPGGILAQWVQGYEIDLGTLRLIYATLTSVFGAVETWQTSSDDMILICSDAPIRYDAPLLRRRIQEEPFKAALAFTWRAIDLEGFLARFVAGRSFAQALVQGKGVAVNTDDGNLLEYAFARTVGQDYAWSLDDLRKAARLRRADRPDISGGDVDWGRVDDERISMTVAEGVSPVLVESLSPDQRRRAEAQIGYVKGNTSDVITAWQQQPRPPSNPTELAVIAVSLADNGSDACLSYVEQLRQYQPAEADAILAHFLIRQGKLSDAVVVLRRAFEQFASDPWPWSSITSRALKDAATIARQDRNLAPALLDALKTPFAVYILDEERVFSLVWVASRISPSACVDAIQAYEPDVPWLRDFLTRRVEWYEGAHDPRAASARRDLDEFLRNEPEQVFDIEPARK